MDKRWWHHSVAYQVYPKSFLDTNGDGIGDIKGITRKLDYMNELGIDVLWISPFFQSPMKDNGYDISDYKAIDPMFGTMSDFDEMMDKADELGIKILVDLVVNHTSDQHPWFLESKSSKENPKRDWYIWKEGKQFNNWRSCFGGSVWSYDETTESSYFHYFHQGQPCLNWENKEVREAIYEMINWWLDKGVGGFRVDAINVIKKGPLDYNYPIDAEDGLASAMPGVANVKGIEVFLSELAEKTFNKYDIMTVAESDVPTEEQSLWTGPKGFFDMAFQFKSSMLDIEDGVWSRTREFNLTEYKNTITEEQEALSDNTWAAVWLENHDNPRAITKYLGDEAPLEAQKMLAVSYFFLKGTPFIYQGQEIGMRNIRYKSINEYDDIASIDHYKRALDRGYSVEEALGFVYKRSRDNSRYPMQWNSDENYGFSNVKPWLGVNYSYPEITVKNALSDSNSLWYFYKNLIALRKDSKYREVFSYGVYKMILSDHESVYGYKRKYKSKEVIVLCNFSNETQEIKLECSVQDVLISNYQQYEITKDSAILKPYQALVLTPYKEVSI